MRTLILNGSPRKNGDTETLILALTEKLQGEIRILSPADQISPCVDCRYCWENPGCTIQDDMSGIYPYLENCDNIVLASPIWFSSLSGPLLTIASRVQTLFAASFFRGEPVKSTPKNGLILLTGAEPGTERAPTQTALTILKWMNVPRTQVETVVSMDTNRVPAAKDTGALERIRTIAARLKETEN